MAKNRGTTTKPGKVTTQKPTGVPRDRMEDPHSGVSPRKVGAQTEVERNALLGSHGGRGVRDIGPTEIRQSGKVGSDSSVRRVGEATYEDTVAAGGGVTQAPGTRQDGAVRQVGPASLEYSRLVERSSSPRYQTQLARFSPKRGDRTDKGVPLLKGGTGRAHAWSRYAETPGTQRAGRGFSTESLMISGRKRVFGAEPFDPRRDMVTPKAAVVPGDTDLYPKTKKEIEEE